MLGAYIHELRGMKGMSIGKLEKASGVSKSYISKLERGVHAKANVDIICRLADALGKDRLVFVIESGILD